MNFLKFIGFIGRLLIEPSFQSVRISPPISRLSPLFMCFTLSREFKHNHLRLNREEFYIFRVDYRQKLVVKPFAVSDRLRHFIIFPVYLETNGDISRVSG